MIINVGEGGGGVIVQNTAPTGDSTMIWIDTGNNGRAKYWNGSAWVEIHDGRVIVQSSTPTGDSTCMWIDTGHAGRANYWNGSAWTLVPAVWT